YMIWTYHGEKAPPQNLLDGIMEDVEFERMFDAYDSFDEGGGDDDGGCCNGDDGVNEGGDDNGGYDSSGDDEFDDSDFLSPLLRHTKAELLVESAKGLANFEAVKKSAEENVYKRSKGCPKHLTMLRFILELLILKAKHGWSDGSFNNLLPKKLVSPFTMGVERIHAYPNHCILYRGDTFKGLDKCPVCSASQYKNNSSYCDDDKTGASWWKDTVFFGDKPDLESASEKLDGHYVFDMVRTIQVPYGKMTKDGKKRNIDKPPIDGVPFKKLSIFYKYLSYWSNLEVRHAIHSMHLKKNVFGNTIGLFLETSTKTKDTLKYELPPASYNLTLDEKKAMCQSLRGIGIPSQFSSNIRKLVSMKYLSLSGYNYHDCHVMLMLFLPIAIRAIKHVYVKMVITLL
uniref:Uncharacterized protein n=1 Tax=Setaria italica TaxID=4555 RepID=K3ZN46_SETIT